MSTRLHVSGLALSAAALLLFAACSGDGDADVGTGAGDDPNPAAACLEGTEDCDDTVDPGDEEPALDQDSGAAGGTCLAGSEECADDPSQETPPPGPPPADESASDEPGDDRQDPDFDADQARAEARASLGLTEAEVEEQGYRVGRRGSESYALIENYVLGRITVELDDDGSGTFVVTAATVELPDGPETFTAQG